MALWQLSLFSPSYPGMTLGMPKDFISLLPRFIDGTALLRIISRHCRELNNVDLTHLVPRASKTKNHYSAVSIFYLFHTPGQVVFFLSPSVLTPSN